MKTQETIKTKINITLPETGKFLAAMVLIFIVSMNSFGQTCCSGGVPLGGSLGLGAADHRSLQVLLTYDYNALNDLLSDSEQLDDRSRSRTTQSSILELNYGISPRVSIAGVLPYIRQTRTIQTYSGSEDFTAVDGLGDVVFLLKYQLIVPDIHSSLTWILGAGPKIPTGKTNYTNSQGLSLAADMQPGSGSLDGIFWSYFQKNKIFTPNLGLASVITYRYSGTNRNYNETQAYRFGNEFQFNLGLNYDFYAVWPITAFLFTRYRNQTEDYIDGNVFPSSGGHWVYTIPGLNIQFSPHASLRLLAELPVYRRLEGTQLTTAYKYAAAISITIPTKKNSVILF